jgi:hypothetical protein
MVSCISSNILRLLMCLDPAPVLDQENEGSQRNEGEDNIPSF